MLTKEKLEEIHKATYSTIVSGAFSDLDKAIDRCDPIAIEYALGASRLLQRQLKKKIITVNEHNKLEDDLKTIVDKFTYYCKCNKK